MKILLAPDSFKGSLSAVEVCRIAAAALRESIKDVTVQAIPVADGGEGTVDSFVFAIGAERREAVVTGPRGLKVCAAYAVAGDTAIIEMAQASGLPLMLGQPFFVDHIGHGIRKCQIAARPDRDPFICISHRRLALPRVDDDDAGALFFRL